jgi:hypothetical protein
MRRSSPREYTNYFLPEQWASETEEAVRARKAVELAHNQRVAAAREFQRVAQGWSIRNRARQLLGKNLRASRFGERVHLQGEILVNGRNPRVAEQHSFRRPVLAGSRR